MRPHEAVYPGGVGREPSSGGVKSVEVKIDLDVAPPTRVSDALDGGDAHFSVDREVAEQMIAAVPRGLDGFRAVGRSGQAFLTRVVRMAVDDGVRQFLVTGSKLAGKPNVHEISQALAPESRVVYLVLDPIMLAFAHTLRSSTAQGATAFVRVKLRDTDEILQRAAETFDLSSPVAVIIPDTLAFVRRSETAYRIVRELMDGLPSGSYLMLTHHASDLFVDEHRAMYECIARLAAEGKTWGVTPRSRGEVTRFFDGLELVSPGVAPLHTWRVPEAEQDPLARGAMHAGVGRKAW
jgi:S-adenosyl methyltransferase